MKTVTQYREDIAGLKAKVDAVRTKCTAESRDPVPEEISHMNNLMGDMEEIDKIVATWSAKSASTPGSKAPRIPGPAQGRKIENRRRTSSHPSASSLPPSGRVHAWWSVGRAFKAAATGVRRRFPATAVSPSDRLHRELVELYKPASSPRGASGSPSAGTP
jgi:hypothetical protein